MFVSNSIEKFYDDVGVAGPVAGEQGSGWVAREVEKALSVYLSVRVLITR